jgi:hypothetical protein
MKRVAKCPSKLQSTISACLLWTLAGQTRSSPPNVNVSMQGQGEVGFGIGANIAAPNVSNPREAIVRALQQIKVLASELTAESDRLIAAYKG